MGGLLLQETETLPMKISPLSFIGLLVFLFCFQVSHVAHSQTVVKTPIRIGVIIPLTGGLASRGEDMTGMASVLKPFLDQKSTKYTYEFIFEDGKCGVGNAPTSAAMKLININKVKFLITGCSGETLQVGPLAQRAGVLDIAVISNNPQVRELGDYVFRTFVDIDAGIKGIAERMKKNSTGKIAILTEENTFTQNMKKILLGYLGDRAGYNEDFLTDTTAVDTMLVKAKESGATGIYLNMMSEGPLANFVNHAKSLQIKVPLYTYMFPETPSFRELTGSNSDGIEFIGSPETGAGSPEYQEVFSTYLKVHQKQPVYEFGVRTFFDAVQSIVDGIESEGNDPAKVKEFLKSYSKPGALGTIEYDEVGDIKHIHYVLRKLDSLGKAVVIDHLDR